MKVAIYTLGCKVNQYETQAMEQCLRERGHEIVPPGVPADAYVINTCSVTAVSDQKSRQAIHRVRREHPFAVLAVCGCYPQTHSAEMEHLDADLIAGTGDRMGFLTLLEETVREKRRRTVIDRAFDRHDFELLPAGGLESRTRAMLKIEDGCVNFCSYCIIPYARGPVRSLPLEEAARQAAHLAEAGYREIVLTGIEISSWGKDLPGKPPLTECIRAIAQAAPETRLRLGSLEPRTVDQEFCRRCAGLSHLCPQFHLSLQSGCDETLRRMNRKYDTRRYLASVNLLRQYFPRPAITTDLIVGFPQETEEEFARTLEFLRLCAFARVHVFPYSPRPGTVAASLPQVPGEVKARRAKEAAAVAGESARAYLEGCVGQRYMVLFEQEKNGVFSGHAPNYAEVHARGKNLHNTVKTVQITGVDGTALLGTLLEDTP